MNMKKLYTVLIFFSFIFCGFSQDIELPDISTDIVSDSVNVSDDDLPDFKNRVTNIDSSGNIVPELPQIESPETETLSSFESSETKNLFAEGLVGGGFPALFRCDFSLFRLYGTEPFSLKFSHNSAAGYTGESLSADFFDRDTSLEIQKSFSKNKFSFSIDGSYNSLAEGLQNQTPLFTSLNKEFVSADADFQFDFSEYFSLEFNLPSYFYTRYSRTSLSLDSIKSLEVPNIFYESAYFALMPQLNAEFSFKEFYGIFSGKYSFVPNLYGLDKSVQDSTIFHRGKFGIELGWKTDFVKVYANAAAVVGNFINGENVLVPFCAGVEYSIPVYFSNRRFSIGAEGGLGSKENSAAELEQKYKFSALTFLPDETAFWYGKFNLSVPLKSSFSGTVEAEYKQNALNSGFWEPDYSDNSKSYGVYSYSKNDLKLLSTAFSLSYHYKILTLSGGWKSNWLDVPVLENIQLLTLQFALQDENALWGIEIQGMYSFENSLTVPLINFEGFIGITPSVRIVLNATDVVKLVTAEKRSYAGEYIGRGGSASLLMKFFL